MVHLSISNIGWAPENDEYVYGLMRKYGFSGIEIAPTRVFPEKPYDHLGETKKWAENLKKQYGFYVSSMQSIWFGRQEKIFGSKEEREALLEYTKKAIDFAKTAGCKNLVFGCPRNRNLPEGSSDEVAVVFFKSLGDYASENGTVIGMEANPPIYNTNYINTTQQAINLIERVNSSGFKLNLDVGTIIENGEDVEKLKGKINLINHIHISEPGLKPIKRRSLHKEIKEILDRENYSGFVSIEMGKTGDTAVLEECMEYVRGIFG